MKAAFVLVAGLLLGACQTTKPVGISTACANEIAAVERYNLLRDIEFMPPIVLRPHCLAEQIAGRQIEDTRPTSVNPIAPPKGPRATKGAVLFINGVDYAQRRRHHIDESTISVLDWISFAELDVYRLDLSVIDQSRFNLIFAAMDRAIGDMRGQGYRRVFVAGHSIGAVAALVSVSSRPVQSDGAVLFAAGFMDASQSRETNLHRYQAWTSAVQPDKRIAVFHFRDDEIFGALHEETVEISRQTLGTRRNAMVRVPSRVTGHDGTKDFNFYNIYGRCLGEFLAAENPNERVCPP
jgi:pimeloyl-ACP methyl ester carboxylesterase